MEIAFLRVRKLNRSEMNTKLVTCECASKFTRNKINKSWKICGDQMQSWVEIEMWWMRDGRNENHVNSKRKEREGSINYPSV